MAAISAAPERIIGSGVAADISAPLERHGLGKKLLLVCDDTTWEVLGERVFSNLAGYELMHHSLGKRAKPLREHTEPLLAMAGYADGLLAVGSGTVNDITKYVAAQLKKPYVVCATAASMNGYTSATASLEEDGFRHSHPARPPKAVIADMDIIVAAPRRMARAGLGDTLARATVEPDCLLSHYLLGTSYPKEAFDCLRAHEMPLLSNAIQLTEANPNYMRILLNALLDAGDWMAATGSSAIASQGEHMVAHTAEMLYGAELYDVLHGELVTVTTATMCHLQHKVILTPMTVKPTTLDEEKFIRLFGKKMGPKLSVLYKKKLLSAQQAQAINKRLAKDWPDIKNSLRQIMRSPITIERASIQANLPLMPNDLGLTEDRFTSAMTYAHLTRDRFTFLDVAAMMGKRI